MLDRRTFLAAVAASAVAGVTACSAETQADPPDTGPGKSSPAPSSSAPPVPAITKVRLPAGGELRALPAGLGARVFALTVDDGTNADVIRAYTEFARDSGVRLTYFVNGIYDGWTQHAGLLRPLVESGQIQLANHTWSHPDLTSLSAGQVAEQLTRNGRFLKNTYGADAAPFFRPPYGFHNATVDRIAADVGYTCPTLWNGSFGDSSVVTPNYIVEQARKFFKPAAVVIGHLNHPPVTRTYTRLLDVIHRRQLHTVTLNDVFAH